MKRILVVCLLFHALWVDAQVLDLGSKNSAPIEIHALYNHHEKLYGYLSLVEGTLVGDGEKAFDYQVYDLDLSLVAEGELLADKKTTQFRVVPHPQEGLIFQPTYLSDMKKPIPMRVYLSLEKNAVSTIPTFYVDHEGRLQPVPDNISKKKLLRLQSKARRTSNEYNYDILELGSGHCLSLSFDQDPITKKAFHQRLMCYDDRGEVVWRVEDIFDREAHQWSVPRWGYITDDFIFILLEREGEDVGSKDVTGLGMYCIDLASGELCAEEQIGGDLLSDIDLYSTFFKIRQSSNGVSTFGLLHDRRTNFTANGYFRVRYDQQTGAMDYAEIRHADLQTFIPYRGKTKKGRVGAGDYLMLRDVFLFKDGSSALVLEEFRDAASVGGIIAFGLMGTAIRDYSADDYYVVMTDSNFEVKDVVKIKKDRTLNGKSSYVAGQMNEARTLGWFQFLARTKNIRSEKKRDVLATCLLDGDGLGYAEVALLEDHYNVVDALPAKEGFALLREEEDVWMGSVRLRLVPLNE